MFSTLPSFKVAIGDDVLDDLQRRLQLCRWPAPAPGEEWQHGCSMAFMQKLHDHWLNRYDWRVWEERLNQYPQYLKTCVWGDIHLLVAQGSSASTVPVILTHGWPGSAIELLEMVDRLAHPERFGGKIEDGRTVIVPSLPATGFSSVPNCMPSPREIASVWHDIMVNDFGCDQYIAHGGDIGSAVSAWLALDYPQHLAGLHLNNSVMQPMWTLAKQPPSEDELAWLGSMEARLQGEDAYQQIHGTKPLTLAYSLSDSPLGLAAWISEKVYGWSVANAGDSMDIDFDHLISNIMMYWLGDPGGASWIYRYLLDMSGFTLPEGQTITAPAGLCLFANDIAFPPPDSWLQRSYSSLLCCSRHRNGGHFPGLENPQLLSDDLIAFTHLLSPLK